MRIINESTRNTANEFRLVGLFRRKECLVLTGRGWLVLIVLAAAIVCFAARSAYGFLAVSDPMPGGALVVEGWLPDYALSAAMSEFTAHKYTMLYVTGGPLTEGAPLSEYKTCAQLGAATLIKLGMSTNEVRAVPSCEVRRDRTYSCALALRDYLQRNGGVPASCTLFSLGAHSRRSRLLFQKAFGTDVHIGIINTEDHDYDCRRWWRSSAGFRTVTGEILAFVYARFFFDPTVER